MVWTTTAELEHQYKQIVALEDLHLEAYPQYREVSSCSILLSWYALFLI